MTIDSVIDHTLCAFCSYRQQLISDKNGVCIDCDQGFNNGTLSLFVNKSEVLTL